MRGWRSALLGLSTAVLSGAILAGSLLLSFVENGYEIAQQSALTFTMTLTPFSTQLIIPGRPTRTATTTSTATATATPTPTVVPPTASPTPTPLPPSPFPYPTYPSPLCGPPPGWVVYVVQYGDTLAGLSRRLNVPEIELQWANCMGSYQTIFAGQTLFLPFYPPLVPDFPPPPPSTPIFYFTPIYTYEEPPTNTVTPTATATPTSTATSTSTPSPSPTTTATATSTNTVSASLLLSGSFMPAGSLSFGMAGGVFP